MMTHLHSPAPRVDAPCSARAFHWKLSFCILLHLTVNQNKLYDPGQALNCLISLCPNLSMYKREKIELRGRWGGEMARSLSMREQGFEGRREHGGSIYDLLIP